MFCLLFASGFNTPPLWGGFEPVDVSVCGGIKPAYNPYLLEPTTPSALRRGWLIEDLIEAGVDVLNPIQPESMNYREIVSAYGEHLSFHGCIGTQTVLPFGSPSEVKAAVKECLDAMGPKGGMLAAPTHVLEPEVPWENIIAYVEACREYSEKKP